MYHRRAYHHHKPDLVVYVDRLDSSMRAGGELPALRVLSESLGPGFWLNTIVVLSHAGKWREGGAPHLFVVKPYGLCQQCLPSLSLNKAPVAYLHAHTDLSHTSPIPLLCPPVTGTPPPRGAKGVLSFEAYANQRSHMLQQVIRSASGDSRLMNPTAFVESHPNCE